MKMTPMSEPLYDYLLSMGSAEHPLLAALRAETATLPEAGMQVPPEQGALMALLAQCIGARHILEVGVFTGYSSLAMALALPDFGRITACDISERFITIAQRYWREAGVEHKVDLRLGPASDTLQQLLQDGQAGHYDMAFIDADKQMYDAYYELALELLRPGGVIVLDNVLWHGAVLEAGSQDVRTLALRALNQKIAQDSRVRACMLPMADGITLARKGV